MPKGGAREGTGPKRRCTEQCQVFSKVRLILVGDNSQLPCVCQHRRRTSNEDGDDDPVSVCPKCDVTLSPYWAAAHQHLLTGSVRHMRDPTLSQFLNIIRARSPTPAEISAVLGECYVDAAAAQAVIDAGATVLCTHKCDVHMYNTLIFERLFCSGAPRTCTCPATASGRPYACTCGHVYHIEPIVHPTPDALSLATITGFADWASDAQHKHHLLRCVASGCKVLLRSNMDFSAGATNGSAGRVTCVMRTAAGAVTKVLVRLDAATTDAADVVISQNHIRRTYQFGGQYAQHTHALELGYAMTAHKAQGATIPSHVLLHVRTAFAPGQLYVMLSRVTERQFLHILTPLTPGHFVPRPL